MPQKEGQILFMVTYVYAMCVSVYVGVWGRGSQAKTRSVRGEHLEGRVRVHVRCLHESGIQDAAPPQIHVVDTNKPNPAANDVQYAGIFVADQ